MRYVPIRRKAAEHRRTSQRKRKLAFRMTATFWTAAVFCRFLDRRVANNPNDPRPRRNDKQVGAGDHSTRPPRGDY